MKLEVCERNLDEKMFIFVRKFLDRKDFRITNDFCQKVSRQIGFQNYKSLFFLSVAVGN